MERVVYYLKIVAGTFLMALAINMIFEPMGMVPGGFAGLGITVKQFSFLYLPWKIPVWLTNFSLNVPVFLWAYFKKGKRFFRNTLFANLCYTLFLYIIPIMAIEKQDYVLASVLGGAITGVGLGLVFSTGNSTGGTDLLSSLIQHDMPYCSVAAILFVIDSAIILSGMLLFGVYTGVYAAIAVYVSSRVMDAILTGMRRSRQILIISDEYQKIGEEVLERLHRGVTCLFGTGMYSNQDKKVLLCVMGRKQVVTLIEIVKKYDKKAFIIIQDASEVVGEGFRDF